MVLAHIISEGNRTCDVQITQDVTFESMLLSSNTLQGLKQTGFYKPSPVQLHGIPLGKCGFDLLLEAKSGTGKTAVFTVISLEKLDLQKGLQTVVLAPTREIASQICDVIKEIGSTYKGLVVEVVMGGMPVEEDILKFKKTVHIVVGSPGRLRHLVHSKHVDLSSVRLLILDEADKLMEKSFQADINYIFSISPPQKQVIMSSATYPENIKEFINKYVKNAQHVCPDSNSVLLGIEQKITVVECNTNIVRQTKYRFEELTKILTKKQFKQCLIFCNYQVRVAELHKLLTRGKWPVEQLCGQQDQTDRLDALRTLKEYKCRILVSTDLAARGIDASNVDLVINFEPPFEWQTYLHRIGRAGRYGSYGMAITILSKGREEMKFKELLETINLNKKVQNLWVNANPENELQLSNMNSHNKFTLPEAEVVYNDVWNNLISESVKHDEGALEEFGSLCKSFEQSSRLNIESFTDLMNDFEESKKTASLTEIYNTKSKPKGIRSFLESMKSLKNNNENTVESKCSTNLPETLSTGYNKHESETFTSYHITESKTFKKQYNVNELNNSSNECFTLHNTASSKALIDAGLPVSFGSFKNCNYKSGPKRNNPHNSHNKKLHSDIQLSTGLKAIDIPNEKCDIHSRKKQEPQSYEIKKMQNQDKSAEHIEYESYRNIRSGLAGTKNSDTPHKTKVFADNNMCTQDYMNWYVQFKNRVKQIEMALYIDEITKL